MKPSDLKTQIAEIFAFWQETMKHPRARLDRARSRAVAARLREGYTVGEIKNAILGCRSSAFHQGDNEYGAVYDDLTLICRSGSKLEQFIGYLQKRPRPKRDPLSGRDPARLEKEWTPTPPCPVCGKQLCLSLHRESVK